MAFLSEYLRDKWEKSHSDQEAQENWVKFLEAAEKDRQRDRIVAWRDRTSWNDFAANMDESEYYVRTAGFVWRVPDPTGKNKAANHQYLYNLKVYGHKQYSRRDKSELEAAQRAVLSRVASGELGPLSPLN